MKGDNLRTHGKGTLMASALEHRRCASRRSAVEYRPMGIRHRRGISLPARILPPGGVSLRCNSERPNRLRLRNSRDPADPPDVRAQSTDPPNLPTRPKRHYATACSRGSVPDAPPEIRHQASASPLRSWYWSPSNNGPPVPDPDLTTTRPCLDCSQRLPARLPGARGRTRPATASRCRSVRTEIDTGPRAPSRARLDVHRS